MIYLVLFVAMIICSFMCKDKEKNDKYYKVFFFILTGMLIIRYGEGPDYFNYQYVFNQINLLSDLRSLGDVGFNLIIFLFKQVSDSYILFSAMIGGVSMIFINSFIKRYSTNKLLSLTVFYPFYYMVYLFSAVRQGLAMTIFCAFLIPLLLNKKYIKYVVGVLLLSLLHMSAIFTLALVVVPFINFVNPKVFVAFLSAILVFKLLGVQGFFIELLPDYLQLRATSYIGGGISLSAVIQRVGLLVIIGVLYWKGSNEEKEKNKGLMNLYIVGFLIYIVLMDMNAIASRLNAYIKIIEVILIANFVPVVLAYKKELIKYSMIALLCYAILIKNVKMTMYQSDYYDSKSMLQFPFVTIFNQGDIFKYKDIKDTRILNFFGSKYQWPPAEIEDFEELPDIAK
ncbi:MAG: EpsG family protein [Clostridium sp.]